MQCARGYQTVISLFSAHSRPSNALETSLLGAPSFIIAILIGILQFQIASAANNVSPGDTTFNFPGGVAELWLPKHSEDLPVVRYGLAEPAILDAGERWRVLIGLDLERLPGDYVVYIRQETEEDASQFAKFQVRHRNYALNSKSSNTRNTKLIKLPSYDELSELGFNNSQPPLLPMQLPFTAKWNTDFGQRVMAQNGNSTQTQRYTFAAATVRTLVKAPQQGIVSKIVSHKDGKTDIVIDHGRGIYSILFGLSDLAVDLGNGVIAGAVIGKVPELNSVKRANDSNNTINGDNVKPAPSSTVYWQVQLNGVFVNPLILTKL